MGSVYLPCSLRSSIIKLVKMTSELPRSLSKKYGSSGKFKLVNLNSKVVGGSSGRRTQFINEQRQEINQSKKRSSNWCHDAKTNHCNNSEIPFYNVTSYLFSHFKPSLFSS